MDWLSEWLQSIIMVILFAVLLDLLLPSQTMQRYVRTVMSLFILFMLLSPVISLLDREKQTELALAGMLESKTMAGDAASVTSIQREAEALIRYREEQSLQLVQAQAEKLIKNQLEQAFPIRAATVQTMVSRDAAGEAVLQHVEVTVTPLPAEAASSKDEAAAARLTIEPIKPVTIEVKAAHSKTESSETKLPQNKTIHPEAERLMTQIAFAIQKDWHIGQERIIIHWND